MDDTRPAGHSSKVDDKSDRGAHERVDPLRNGRSTRTENLLGNPFRPWIAAWCDRSSRSDESTSGEIRTRRTCPDWKFPAEEVSSNLHRLKEVMETGRVTDTSYSVAGKFAQRQN